MKIAVIGAGKAGRQFAALCAGAEFTVVLEDVMPAKLRQASEELAGLGECVQLVGTVDDAVRNADVVVDFVPDELESKLEIWSLIDRMAPPHTVMCTPSEVLSISDLASCTYRPERCVMVRGALQRGSRVRVLSAAQTSAETGALVAKMLTGLGCKVSCEEDPDLPMLLKNMRSESL